MKRLNTFINASNTFLGVHFEGDPKTNGDFSRLLYVDTSNNSFLVIDPTLTNARDLHYELRNKTNVNTVLSLFNQYNKQKKKFGQYLEASNDFVDSIFFEVAEKIFELSPSKIKVSLTDSSSIFFSVELRNDFKLRYEVFVRKNESSTVYSLYQSGNLRSRNFGPIDESIAEIREDIGQNINTTSLIEPNQDITFADSSEYTM